MNDGERSRLDKLLDLLADEVAARIRARTELPPTAAPTPTSRADEPLSAPEPPAEPESAPEETPPEPMPSHAAPLMFRLAIGVLLLVVLINIPYNAQGTAIARSIPSSASLIIANGLLVKEAGNPDVYVYRDGTFHWITSLDAFEQLGYRWADVHTVEAGFLGQFAKGRPLSVLLKCSASPNIYLLEAGRKRWIVDIPTFEAQGFIWQDVKFVSCPYLRGLPDGDSVPPGRGAPPPPLP
jgi:hypothetical protein